MNKDLVVTVEQLSFQYANTCILEDASFSVEKGEFVGIIGPNGGGKTTLLKLILGLLLPSQGSISILGSSPRQAQKHIAYVPQALPIDKQFPISTLEVVLGGLLRECNAFGIYNKKAYEKAFSMLEKLGLSEQAQQSFGSLSGGQAQKTLIARALVSNPKLLLLDEPTASVDAQSEKDIGELLSSLQEDISILMVTHNLRSVIQSSQRILSVHRNVVPMDPKKVCEHFALGVYHSPLLREEM